MYPFRNNKSYDKSIGGYNSPIVDTMTPYDNNNIVSQNRSRHKYSYVEPSTRKFNHGDTPAFDKMQEHQFAGPTPWHERNDLVAMKGIINGIECNRENDDVTIMFYSGENMKRLQRNIKQEIYDRTKGQYRMDDDQDEADLLIAMKAVYLEHARFLPFKPVKQVKELNRKVIEYIVPDMITSMKQAYGYLKEINEPLKPLIRPVNVNNAGRKTLPSLTSVWGF